MDYGRAIRMARAWAGVTQAELARRVGVRAETVSSWEKGKTEPSGKLWRKIGLECGIDGPTLWAWGEGSLRS